MVMLSAYCVSGLAKCRDESGATPLHHVARHCAEGAHSPFSLLKASDIIKSVSLITLIFHIFGTMFMEFRENDIRHEVDAQLRSSVQWVQHSTSNTTYHSYIFHTIPGQLWMQAGSKKASRIIPISLQ